MFLPLQVPGGIELLVIFVIFVLILALPLGLLVVVIWALRRRRGHLEALEARVEALEAEMGVGPAGTEAAEPIESEDASGSTESEDAGESMESGDATEE